jgi:hypothetical protein
MSKLDLFPIDYSRTKVIVPVEFYQMNLSRAVSQARKQDPELFVEGDDKLPNWSKFAKNPLKAKGFWTRILQAVFTGQNSMPELDAEYQSGKSSSGFQVAMMFVPGSVSIRNGAMTDIVNIAAQTLRNWQVLEISGGGTHNGRKITNRNSEEITKEVIAECKRTDTPLLIISRGMAARSYSISEIDSLYLCYDEGDSGATTQKISRALTPEGTDKIGRIYSLSFDPNRDDKFDGIMIAAAERIAKRKNIEMDAALKFVLATIDIFACGENGRVDIELDDYLRQLVERNSLSRIMGSQAHLELLSNEEIVMIASGNSDYSRVESTETADKGKIGLTKPKNKSAKSVSDVEDQRSYEQARRVLVTVVEHLPYITYLTDKDTIRESLEKCVEVDYYGEWVEENLGLKPDYILGLFDRGVLKYNLACLQKRLSTISE